LNEVVAFYARVDDVSMFNSDRVTRVSFHRKANTLDEAIRSAIADLRASGFAVKQIEVEPQCVGA
jgi:hypothetical protein